MPDIVSIAVSTGIGVSVLAGIVSGVCFVLAHGFRKKRIRRHSAQWHCAVCDGYLRSFEGVLEGERVVTCERCDERVCKVRCSRRDSNSGGWICETCFKQPVWYHGILRLMQPPFKVTIPRAKMNPDRIQELEDDLEAIRKKQREQVRDFIEKIVTSMLGGDVDDVKVTKLYNDKHYDAIFARYHEDLSSVLVDLGSALHVSIANLPVTGDSPCTAHAALKQLIQKLIREAQEIPSLRRAEDHPALPADESNRTYEDLLSSAIINKVINNCQHNLPSSSANSVSSRQSTSSRNRDDGKEYFFGEETLDSKWKTTDLDSTSVSSLEEWIQSDSSLGSTKYVDRVSLTIQHRIEEVSPTDSEAEEDEHEDADYFKRSTLVNDEDSNWYLQKRQFKGTHSPVPVPMLVPNPTNDAKVLIGDKEVDDTSDLSDVCSDYGDTEAYPDITNVLIDSKTVIGGKNILENVTNGHASDDELSADSGVKVGSEPFEGNFCPVPRTDKTLDDDNIEDASILSTYSNTEKDTEYTERYASLPRTIYKSPPTSSSNGEINGISENTEQKQEENDRNDDEGYENIEFTGAYSRKEKEKWKHAVDMKNNPYSKENIEKRLKARSSVSSIFGSDYYARLASNPSGGKLKEPSDECEVSKFIPESLAQPDRRPKDDVDSDRYPAVPAKILSDEEVEPNIYTATELTIKETSDADTSLSEITSDSDMSYVNCYDVEKAKVFRRPSDEVAKPKINGVLYKQKDDNDIILDIITRQLIDENHNSEYPDKDKFEISILNKDVEEKVDEPPKQINNNKVNIVEMKLKSDNQLLSSTDDNDKNDVTLVDSSTKQSTREEIPQSENREMKFEKAAISELSTPHYQKFTVTNEIKVPQQKSNLEKKIDVSLAQTRTKKLNQVELANDANKSTTHIILNKKSDNTLIKKIYSDPSVRSFVLSSRENLPVIISGEDANFKQDEKHKSTSALNLELSTNDMLSRPLQRSMSSSVLKDNYKKPRANSIQRCISVTPTYDSDSVSEMLFSLESSEFDKSESTRSLVLETDPEIAELKEKRLVASRLGEISKSFPNVSKIHGVKLQKVVSTDHSTSMSTNSLNMQSKNGGSPISVKDLKKKFETPDTTCRKEKQPIYSLTARSLSKQVRENLKNQSIDEPLSIEVVKCESPATSPEAMVEVKIEEPVLSTENKIKFYEKLNE